MSSMVYERPGRKPTYKAVYRLAARPYGLSWASGGAARKQFATLHHAATAKRWKRIRTVEVAIESASAAAIVVAELRRITTAPATGNPATTPVVCDPSDIATECVALALPTTPATETDLFATLEWNLGITGAASTANPPPPLSFSMLYSATDLAGDVEQKPILLKPGAIDGIAVTLDASASATVVGLVVVTYTEETGG